MRRCTQTVREMCSVPCWITFERKKWGQRSPLPSLSSITFFLQRSSLSLIVLMSGRPCIAPLLGVHRPTVTQIKGIRSTFCFRVAGDDTLAVRELSCRCSCCLGHRWTECKSVDAGNWTHVVMSNTAASAGSRTRNQRNVVSHSERSATGTGKPVQARRDYCHGELR